jgi:hypothetical protein
MVNTMKLQISNVGQATLTVPKAIVEGKSWKHGQELVFKFGPRGEVILEERSNK